MEGFSRKALSLELLNKHQQRIQDMITRIDKYEPNFDINKDYFVNREKVMTRIINRRQKINSQIFNENLYLINRLESAGPKIETTKFPPIKLNPKRLKSLSQRSTSTCKSSVKSKGLCHNQEQLLEQNIKLITTIESIAPKIKCWQPKQQRKLNQLIQTKKQQQQQLILEKQRQIARQLQKITAPGRKKSRVQENKGAEGQELKRRGEEKER